MRPEGEARGYASDALWLLSAQIGSKVASFIFIVMVARSLATTDFGYFNFALSLVPMFLVVGGVGLESTAIRELARDRARLSELFVTGLALRVALGLAGLGLALAAAPFLVEGGEAYTAVAIVGVALFLDEVTGFVGTVFKAFERMKFHALAVFVNRVFSTALAGVALAAGGGLVALCTTYLIGSAGALGFALMALRREFPPIHLRAATRRVARELVRTGAPLGLAGALNMAVFRVDSVLLQGLKGAFAVGLYGAAYRLFESMLFVAWSLGNVALPRLARAEGRQALTRMFELTSALALAFYLPFAVTTPFASEWILTSIFSERYAGAATALSLLAIASVFYALAFLARVGAIALGRRAAVLAVAALALVANVVGNIVAIPRYGFEGAAAVMLGTEAFEAALLVILLARFGRVRPTQVVLAPLAAALGLGAVLAAFELRDGAALAVAAVLYPAALALTSWIFARSETRLAVSLLRRRPLAV